MPANALTPVELFELILLLMAIVLPLELLARRLRLPPAAALIVGGMVLALLPGQHDVELDPDLTLVLFLPPLLLSSAYFTVWRDFRANLRIILQLAVGAVVFTTLVVGVVAHWAVPSLPWAACFALGAIVSPPDAVAAKAVLQRVSLPPRMTVLLEGESLVNDASGLVLFRLAVAAALTGTFSARAPPSASACCRSAAWWQAPRSAASPRWCSAGCASSTCRSSAGCWCPGRRTSAARPSACPACCRRWRPGW